MDPATRGKGGKPPPSGGLRGRSARLLWRGSPSPRGRGNGLAIGQHRGNPAPAAPAARTTAQSRSPKGNLMIRQRTRRMYPILGGHRWWPGLILGGGALLLLLYQLVGAGPIANPGPPPGARLPTLVIATAQESVTVAVEIAA